ncbi:dTDP-4-dehydrorhamnose 3,5-epimerase [Marinobacter sp. M216]|uniref:dTDP-4-dehydrorhamnose 3,5-epimerase n=1 Tax=Marinobacter albus TaxID=3030833 RepID=A0ABT7HBG2_9GAMM|nr:MULTISPECIES: dTDP-4-dehydrorhamnose 3,5-epimerase [unclassified Marinobacter]MBW7470475.1 dTDP-4-dehydrorhamnose 3,5-epimerase [Marinobacter sp. F4218]MDK9557257.1 dTDP-4-dehydrorhamnose 3,5-epimerase [Marinobacter sp. M216]
MKVTKTSLDGVLILEPPVFGDERGWFTESFNHQKFADAVGREVVFVQDNHSCSARGVLRGIHFQTGEAAQGKLVRVTAGEIYDIAVDLRKSSPTFGQWTGVVLSAGNKKQLWVPAGFGHAFLVTSEAAEVQYKVDAYWSPDHERSLRWDDAEVGVIWPEAGEFQLSGKDAEAPTLDDLKQAGDLFD